MSSDVDPVRLRAEHAIELGELVESVTDWLAGAPDVFVVALTAFAARSTRLRICGPILPAWSCCWVETAKRFVFEGDW